jgi:hypothetical protein
VRQLLGWIRDHKLSTAGLVLVVLGCVALSNLSRRVHHLRPRTAAAAPAAPSASSPVEAPAAAEPLARSAPMRGEFEEARNYADFIRQALARPRDGGQFYALLAWRRCNELAQHRADGSAHTGSDVFHDAAIALVADLDKRCAGVLEAYADAPALVKAALAQPGGRDVLLPPDGRGLAVPATRATADADLDAALKSGDRLAAAEVLRADAGWLDAGNSTGDPAADRQLREWAGEIVACELAGTCRGGVEAALHCASSGDCAHEDWRDVVLAQVPEARRIIFDTMLAALHERVGRTSP